MQGTGNACAILGQGTADAFVPKFLGRTGSRPSGPDYPPYQFDDDSATAMIVGGMDRRCT